TKLGTPVAKDDFQSFCQGYSTQVNIFANDVLTNGGGKPDYDKVDLNPLTVGVFEQVMTRPGGTFSFNKVTKNVDFVPTPGFIGSESIQYLFQDLYGKASNSATIKVETLLPVITQQPVISPICENQDFSVTVTGNGGSSAGVLSYQWQYFNDIKNDWEDQLDGNGISGARTNTLISVNTPLSNNGLRYRVKLTSTSTDAQCEVYSVPATLTVNPLPAATISAVTPVCPGSPDVGLTFTGSKGTAPYTFTYTVNNGTPQTVTSATGSSSAIVYQSAAVSGDFVYKITSVSDASSTHCSVAQAVSSTVTVRPPATKPTITAGSREFCEGTALSISSSASSGNQWYKDGNLISGADKRNYVVTEAGVYTVLYTNEFGCSTFSDPKEIVVNPRPADPVLTSPSNSYCQNGSVIITSTVAFTYNWYKNGDPILVNGLPYNQRTYTVTEPGNYSVIAVSEKGCQSNPSNTLIITENPLPAAPTFTASATSFCAGSSVVLT
ncbi:MAG: hypothetical protein MUP99_06710, partial [Pedobacter sp.]|nr:hypothetical protein [Pedobacter sp.]